MNRPCDDCGKPVELLIARYCNACNEPRYLATLTPRQREVLAFLDSPIATVVDDARKARDHADPYEGDPERKARFNEAVKFIREYTGQWAFILDLRAHRAWGTKWYRLSDRQVAVVLAAKARQGQRIQIAVPTGRDLNALPYGRTYAAVENESGALTFLLFDRPKPETKWAGWVFVKQQQGPNEVRIGAQRPGATYVGQWPSLIDKVLDNIPAAVVRYGRELGVCGICALPLTNEESREAGIGPVCRARIE